MRARRSLALRREALTELATADLTDVVGAQAPPPVIPTTPIVGCIFIYTGLPCGGPPGSQAQCAD